MFYLIKLLDSIDKKEELEHIIWDFFKQHVCKAIEKYQLEATSSVLGLSAEKFESMLCEVVRNVEAKQVFTIIIHEEMTRDA